MVQHLFFYDHPLQIFDLGPFFFRLFFFIFVFLYFYSLFLFRTLRGFGQTFRSPDL